MSAENQPKYTTELSVNLRLPSDVQLAPDGRRVAFVVAPIAHAESKPTSEIWLAEVTDDANPRRFTTAHAEERSPRWSPDGARLAFLSDRAERGTSQLHLIDAAGGEATALTSLRRGIDQIAWRPDGQALSGTADRLVLAGQQDPPGDIYVASLADRPRVIVQVPIEGGEPSVIGPAEGHVWIYAWSPDGRSVAAITTGSNRLDDRLGNVQFIIIDVATRAERTLATLPFVPDLLQWSPDGTQIVAINETGETPDDMRVILFDNRSGASRTLEPGDTTPAWAGWVGDGSKLLVQTAEGFWTPVEQVDLNDHVTQRLELMPEGGTINGPLSLSDDGKTVALIWQDPQTPPEVWAGPLDGTLNCLTHLNPQLDGLTLATLEPVEWPASDGITIEGWLARPAGADPEARLPLIVHVHGGPSARFAATFRNGWSDWWQSLTAAGYAVFRPNPRGSTGRGPAFTASNRNDLGGMDFDDVMQGVDWLIEAGIADPERIGILGWSYGGFLTAWAITHTDRFKAAVAGAAVTNWPSKVGTTDIRPMNEARFPGKLHETPDAFWERSPIRYLGNATTPTLIVHGQADQRVPVTQGRELYLGLRAAGVPTDFVTYPRQKHPFHERPYHLDLLKRIIAWFDEWMGEGQ
jgi:dipeptidyl aminopeptidase/acylaminoacyl peptidase